MKQSSDGRLMTEINEGSHFLLRAPPRDREKERQNASPFSAAYPLAADKTRARGAEEHSFIYLKKKGGRKETSKSRSRKISTVMERALRSPQFSTIHVTTANRPNIDPFFCGGQACALPFGGEQVLMTSGQNRRRGDWRV
ncbi:uncharacterized protein SPSK_10003 [Sporothrix schenckii 1099-18]|uniref:Uncharacterized protein n=1 Tax=Sporothrix schenckii 1099-18 TaxID=1397361 RepID=A0A0F2M8A4_SPOSC|nr:uncharacterized protein SPSK_10003 [Sporothrix schenckii 1099-18]KJR85035.1 hypothetical protein SPSK_10003 [Sporothrix schenckii 1099-18]